MVIRMRTQRSDDYCNEQLEKLLGWKEYSIFVEYCFEAPCGIPRLLLNNLALGDDADRVTAVENCVDSMSRTTARGSATVKATNCPDHVQSLLFNRLWCEQ